MGRRLKLAIVTMAVAVVALGGCRERWTPMAGVTVPVGPSFDHTLGAHAGRTCEACHATAAVLAGTPARPGHDHAPCDEAGCHARDFTIAASESAGSFCTLCHESVAPGKPGQSPLLAFPPATTARDLPSRFSHAAHLDHASLDAKLGFHIDCIDCHTAPTTEAPYGQISHAACARCHGGAAPLVAPRLTACTSCHQSGTKAQPRARVLARGDVQFAHSSHEHDFAGTAIRCRECHATADTAQRSDTRLTPVMASCVACHDDPARAPTPHAMRVCDGCHVQAFSMVRREVAPRSHLRAELKPQSHTPLFRRDHADAARKDTASCASCHAGLSGLADGCDECHQVMQPLDHGVAFVELLHGDEARVDERRCATCHVADFCTTCHSRTPRSHLPLAIWRGLPGQEPAHGAAARSDLRSCLTCHDPERSCAGSGCHGPGGQP